MVLKLPQLRVDYKATYKSNWPLAERINILIEATKVEAKHQYLSSQAAKRILLAEIITSAGIALRTLQRWKKTLSLSRFRGNRSQEKRMSS